MTKEDIENNPFTRLNIYCDQQPQHFHSFYEFVLISNGICNHRFNGLDEEKLKPGTLMLIRPTEYHQIGFAGKDCIYRDFYIDKNEFKILCDALSPNLFNTINERKERFIVVLPLNVFNTISSKSTALDGRNYQDKKIYDFFSIFHKTIIVELLGAFIQQDINLKNPIPNWLNDLYLHISYSDYVNFSLQEVISKTNYSHGYVSKMFKKYFNISLISFHNRNKILYSCKLLGNMKIIDIANSLGWENPKNYSIEFKRVLGETPSRYLKNKKNK